MKKRCDVEFRVLVDAMLLVLAVSTGRLCTQTRQTKDDGPTGLCEECRVANFLSSKLAVPHIDFN